jgi:hypothetical protein
MQLGELELRVLYTVLAKWFIENMGWDIFNLKPFF